MTLNAVLKWVFILIAYGGTKIFGQTLPTDWYPQNSNEHWTISSFTNGEIFGAQKGVLPGSGGPVLKMVFGRIRLTAARINSVNYVRSQIIALHPVSTTFSDRIEHMTDFTIGTWTVRTIYIFYKDGRFAVRSQFLITSPSSARLYIRFDPDIDGAWNDIVEFPQAHPTSLVQNWFAPVNETKYSVNAMSSVSGNLRERNAYFRVVDASSDDPGRQFFAVFFPFNSNSTNNSQIDFIFKLWTNADEAGTTMPVASPTAVIGNVNARLNDYDQAAYSGPDQVIYAGISGSASPTAPSRYYDIAGKVYSKPNARPLRINFHTEPSRPIPADWVTRPVLFGGSGRSVADAFSDLTTNKWQYARYDNMVNAAVGNMSVAQMHSLMLSERTRVGNYDRDNFRDWTVDVLVLNHKWDQDPQANGLMFDWDAVPREGCVILNDGNPALWDDAWNYIGFAVAHEVGHAIGMHHTWVDNPSATTQLNIMTDKWPFEFAMTWGTYQTMWYKYGPESWVKPGRYGAQGPQYTRSPFIRYFSGATVAP
jgi:hypothetical protein